MSSWDQIYQDYQNGGQAWATLSEDIQPLFQDFIVRSKDELNEVLDIGCGTGKYLKFLQSHNLKTSGIDSSETAVKMSQELLMDKSEIFCVNMFEFEIPKGRYDLIFSISTIHHGTKDQVQNLVNKIYDALKPKGKIFITVPDFEIAKRNEVWKNDQEIEPGTYAPTTGPEKGLPHSFYTEEETQQLFSKFKKLELKTDEIGRHIFIGQKV